MWCAGVPCRALHLPRRASHKSALIAWGAFYFQARTSGRVEAGRRRTCVSPSTSLRDRRCRSEPYGPARVKVLRHGRGRSSARASPTHQPLRDFRALAEHPLPLRQSPSSTRSGAEGVRWDWDGRHDEGARAARRPLRERVPHASGSGGSRPGAFTFIVLGDFGTGIENHLGQAPPARSRPSAAARGR